MYHSNVFQARFGSFVRSSSASVRPTAYISKRLDPNGSSEDWAATCGLNFEYKSSIIKYDCHLDGVQDHNTVNYDKTKVIYRSDNGTPITHVSDRFQPTQPIEVIDLYQRLCKSNHFQMESLGCLKGGRAIWGLARTELKGSTMGQDQQQAYVLLHTPNDGTGSFMIKLINRSLACDNMLNATLQGKFDVDKRLPYLYKIQHSSVPNFDQIGRELEALPEYYNSFLERIDQLANTPINTEDMVKYFISLYGDKYDQVSSATKKHVDKLMCLVLDAPGQELRARRGSVYGALSAVTNYYDHIVSSKSSHLCDATENRFASSNFGNGERIKNKAFTNALEMVS